MLIHSKDWMQNRKGIGNRNRRGRKAEGTEDIKTGIKSLQKQEEPHQGGWKHKRKDNLRFVDADKLL